MIGFLGGHQQAVALGLGQVVDVGSPRNAAGDVFLSVERGRRLEGILGENHVHLRWLHAAGDQHVEREVVRRRVLGQDELLAPQVGDRLDVLADHDPVAAVGEIDLLVDPRHDPAVARVALRIDEALQEKRDHVERRPADVDFPGGVGVAHLDRVVDQHQVDLERLAVGRFPLFPGLEPVVGQNDRSPAGPDVQREPDGVVLKRLVGGHSLDRRQLFGRLEIVLLDCRGTGGVGRFRELPGAQVLGLELALWLAPAAALRLDRLRRDDVAAINRKPDQSQNDQRQGHVECGLRLSGGHCSCSSLGRPVDRRRWCGPAQDPSTRYLRVMPVRTSCKHGLCRTASLYVFAGSAVILEALGDRPRRFQGPSVTLVLAGPSRSGGSIPGTACAADGSS